MKSAKYGPVSDAIGRIINGGGRALPGAKALPTQGFAQVARPAPGQRMPSAVKQVSTPIPKTKAPKKPAMPKRPKKTLVGSKNAPKNNSGPPSAPLATPLGLPSMTSQGLGPQPRDIHVHLHMGKE